MHEHVHTHVLVHSRRWTHTHTHAGPEFEHRILANERNNVKFNFLIPTDPYHAYYQMRVRFAMNMHVCTLAAT